VTPPKTAIIRVPPYSENIQFLFRNKIAGLSPFKRLIFSLQRAGIDNFIVLQENTLPVDQHEIERDIQNDFRFKSNFQWNVLRRETFEEDSHSISLLPEFDKVLVVESDFVTTTGLIKA